MAIYLRAFPSYNLLYWENMLRSKVIAESLAVSSVLSVFIVSLLIGVNHGGYIILGIFYVPISQPIVSVVFYAFLLLGLYYNLLSVRVDGVAARTFRITYIVGFSFATVGVSSEVYNVVAGVNTAYDSKIIMLDFVLVLIGLTGEILVEGKINELIEAITDRDIRDLMLLCGSLLLLSTVRIFNREVPPEATVPFLIFSWALMLHIIKKYVWGEGGLRGLAVKGIVLILSANLLYIHVLLLSV